MSAEVEQMFCIREKPWHGLGTMVANATDSASALRLAGLDWNVIQMEDGSPQQRRNIRKMREDLRARYYDAPDLADVGKNGYRFINAVSDFATHAKPLRERANYRETLFARTVDGNPLIDRAYQMVMAA